MIAAAKGKLSEFRRIRDQIDARIKTFVTEELELPLAVANSATLRKSPMFRRRVLTRGNCDLGFGAPSKHAPGDPLPDGFITVLEDQ